MAAPSNSQGRRSERKSGGKEAQAETALLRAATRAGERGREVFTFNYGSKRVLTHSRCIEGARVDCERRGPSRGNKCNIYVFKASAHCTLTSFIQCRPRPVRVRPRPRMNGLNAMSDKAFSYPMCCLSILNHRVPSSPLPAAYARTLHGTMVFQQRERKRKTISRQMRPPQKVSHSAGPSSWKAGSRATVQPQSRFKPLAVFLLMHMDIIRDI